MNTLGIDVAAGTGVLTMELARYLLQSQSPLNSTILATDFAPEMVNVLQHNLVANNLQKNVEVKVMDGQVCIHTGHNSFQIFK